MSFNVSLTRYSSSSKPRVSDRNKANFRAGHEWVVSFNTSERDSLYPL